MPLTQRARKARVTYPLDASCFHLLGAYGAADVLESRVLPELALDLAPVFARAREG